MPAIATDSTSMAFASKAPPTLVLKRTRRPAKSPRRISPPKWLASSSATPPTPPERAPRSPPSATPLSTPSIPPSLAAACAIATTSVNAALQSTNRLFIEIDTTSGDATYTMLKNSIPIAKLLHPDLPPTQVLLPDAGSAAYARKDWPDANIFGLEEAELGASLIVTPRASEVSSLLRLAETTELLIMLNPDLVDMGVTGLSLNARRLKEGLIDGFTIAYYLKVFPWGVIQRAWPGKWGVWVDDPGSEVGFRLIAECNERPVGDVLDEILSKEFGSGEGLFAKVKRFLSVYMKG